ncbi:hypothetical protein [Methylophaga sp. OBS4]|uniref:hypothetical protein n=1 Tax=Methylophaga sp. OBS4 TaxID=2991935 RepID=UPI00225025C7|nr:hypothetical protein [Methylophaga sp. OBS4]MCX4186824.1 hypothetical protein [Methylophaga sp. OBS4]
MLASQSVQQATMSFKSMKDWERNAPELGREYFPIFSVPTQTYKQWLRENPQGYVYAGALRIVLFTAVVAIQSRLEFIPIQHIVEINPTYEWLSGI